MNKKTSTLLDNIYTNITQSTNSITSGVFKTTYSDHYSIFCITDLIRNSKTNKYMQKRHFSNKNVSIFNKNIKSYNWNYIYSTDKYEHIFKDFHNDIKNIFLDSFPLKTIKIG